MRTFFKVLFFSLIAALYSCETQKRIKDRNSAAIDVLRTTPSESDNSIISYFKGIGTEPFWAIEISKEQIRFTSLNETKEFIVPYVTPIQVRNATIKTYHSKNASGSISVTITQQECSDGMSDTSYNYSVKVSIKRKTDKKPILLEGCGNYIIDYRLHDIWALESIEGTKVTVADFQKEIPYLEMNTQKAEFMGLSGCNRIHGKLFSEDKLLRFTNVISSMMICPEMDKETAFLNALQSATTYEIKNNRLYLLSPDGEKVVFRKVD